MKHLAVLLPLLLAAPAFAQVAISGDNCGSAQMIVQPSADNAAIVLHVLKPAPSGVGVRVSMRQVEGFRAEATVPTWVPPRSYRVLTLGRPVDGRGGMAGVANLVMPVSRAVTIACFHS